MTPITKLYMTFVDSKLEELADKPRADWTLEDWDSYYYCLNCKDGAEDQDED